MAAHDHDPHDFGRAARRRFLRHAAYGAGAFALTASGLWAPGAFAEELARTPAVTEGPFYPDKLPLDTDNDLLIVNETITPAVGEVTYLTGRVADEGGRPVRGALVEIWQVDGNGVYLHSGDNMGGRGPGGNGGSQRSPRDKNFQGFGRCLTGAKGEYAFRTIKPVPYPGRTPHIHVKVKRNGRELLCTQLMIDGHPQNDRDGVFRSAGGALERELLLVEFKPLEGSKIGELTARFDIVLGRTPDDNAAPAGRPARANRRRT